MSTKNRIGAFFAVLIGFIMVAWWTFILVSGNMPELQSTPIAALMHIGAEMLTALTLILGGYGLLTQRRWGPGLHMVSLGMLLYAMTQASGYYAETGEVPMIVMFAGLGVLTLGALGLSMRSMAAGRAPMRSKAEG